MYNLTEYNRPQATPYTVSDLPTAAVQIAAGVATSYALLDDGYVWAWGSGHSNSPARIDAYGVDATRRLHGSPMDSVFVVLADGTAMRNGAVETELGGDIVQIARSSGHTLVLKAAVPDCGATATATYSPISGTDSTRQVSCAGDTEYGGDDCAFACALGYYLSSGASPLTCEVDGSWSAAVCTECTAVPGCTGFETCTTASDEQCTPCSGVHQDLLDWLALDAVPFTAAAIFYYCPTADVLAYQGMPTIAYGKQLYFDGSGGPSGSVSFNGAFRTTGGRYGTAPLTNVVLTPVVEVWATGYNGDGQLGLGDTTPRNTPAQLSSPANVVQVAAGYMHTVFVDVTGAVRPLLLLSLPCERLFLVWLLALLALFGLRVGSYTASCSVPHPPCAPPC